MNHGAVSTLDPDEVARFEGLAREWWNPDGPMKPLHRFNPVRLGFIRDEGCRRFGRDSRSVRPLEGLTVLDVGCGAGLLCEPLARLGADITGIDPAPTNVEVAKLHAARSGLSIAYGGEPIEAIAAGPTRFDIVLAMEVVEHVADVGAFVAACCTVVKPGGLLIMATINRTLRAYALAIVGAEYVLRWLPRGTHRWDKFVTPPELAAAIRAGGLEVTRLRGVLYNPLSDSWALSRDVAVNYVVAAERP